MTNFKILLTAASAVLIFGCSSMSERDYIVKSSGDNEYVYIIDYEKVALVEQASKTSLQNVDTYWVNPPVKRIKRSELEAMQKQ